MLYPDPLATVRDGHQQTLERQAAVLTKLAAAAAAS